eukprot:Sdes_comp17473_c0_seq2m6711
MFARKSLAKLGKNINPTFQVSSPKGNFYHHSASVKHKMKVCQDISEMRAFRESLTATVGFVPTMGSLHEGHLNLVREAKKTCSYVIASIFVNPAQFAAHEDFDKYPRQLEKDADMLKSVDCDALFLPPPSQMYSKTTSPDPLQNKGTFVEVKGLSHLLEGTVRPHFFVGVATVVTKLLNIVTPDVVFLGQKDFQQCVILKKMVQDLCMKTSVKVIETTRELDGLAMSSRNVYLSPEQRKPGLVLYKALKHSQSLFERGQRKRDVLLKEARDIIEKETRVRLQYLSINHAETLETVPETIADVCFMSGAILVGQTRLIDNVLLSQGQ